LALIGVTVLGLGGGSSAWAAKPNEHQVMPGINVLDPDDITSPDSKVWVLHFNFKAPRQITVDIPGKGRRVCWYLWYQVINKTKEPHTFVPQFEFVAHDKNATYRDQILPKVQDAIRKIEEPGMDEKDFKNSVTIAASLIPPSKANATPKAITGVAIWDDIPPDVTHFTIFVAGLSNGWHITDAIGQDAKSNQRLVRRKTLQLNFRRPGDPAVQRAEDIKFLAPAQWVYRGTILPVPGLRKDDEKKSNEKPPSASGKGDSTPEAFDQSEPPPVPIRQAVHLPGDSQPSVKQPPRR